MRLRSLTLDELHIDDERAFEHIGLYDALKQALRRDAFRFNVPLADSRDAHWDRVVFLNLTFWNAAEPVELLVEDHIPADVVMHTAWHHLARRAVFQNERHARGLGGEETARGPVHHARGPSAAALFLGESIASAFDLYLVGRLLGRSPDSLFLETQVPAMAEAAERAGMTSDEFERLLEGVAADPDGAFEDMRALLFDAATTLVDCASLDAAALATEALDGRPFSPLLHHYELSNWILYARAYSRHGHEEDGPVRGGTSETELVAQVDAALRSEHAGGRSALDWLEKNWL